MKELNDMAPQGCRAKVELLGTYDYNKTDIIKDPYYVSIQLKQIVELIS